MDLKTEAFLNVTDAAERLVAGLGSLHEHAQQYALAGGQLTETREASIALIESTQHMANSMTEVLQTLNQLGVPALRDDVHSLVKAGQVQAAQQKLLTESVATLGQVQEAEREVLLGQAQSLEKQREALLSQAESLAKHHSTLVEQQARLLEHKEGLSSVDAAVRETGERIDRLEERVRNQMIAAAAAARIVKGVGAGVVLSVILAAVSIALLLR